MSDRTFAALVRKLHAAELAHLREVVAEQQALIDDQAQQIKQLQTDAWDDELRAEVYHDLANDLRDARPGACIGLTMDGRMGVLQ